MDAGEEGALAVRRSLLVVIDDLAAFFAQCLYNLLRAVRACGEELRQALLCDLQWLPGTAAAANQTKPGEMREASRPTRMRHALHEGIRCDGCGVLPIVGIRYKSVTKADYDLCPRCILLNTSDRFLAIVRPGAAAAASAAPAAALDAALLRALERLRLLARDGHITEARRAHAADGIVGAWADAQAVRLRALGAVAAATAVGRPLGSGGGGAAQQAEGVAAGAGVEQAAAEQVGAAAEQRCAAQQEEHVVAAMERLVSAAAGAQEAAERASMLSRASSANGGDAPLPPPPPADTGLDASVLSGHSEALLFRAAGLGCSGGDGGAQQVPACSTAVVAGAAGVLSSSGGSGPALSDLQGSSAVHGRPIDACDLFGSDFAAGGASCSAEEIACSAAAMLSSRGGADGGAGGTAARVALSEVPLSTSVSTAHAEQLPVPGSAEHTVRLDSSLLIQSVGNLARSLSASAAVAAAAPPSSVVFEGADWSVVTVGADGASGRSGGAAAGADSDEQLG